jgi:general stress protein 26
MSQMADKGDDRGLTLTKKVLAKQMKQIDFCMMTTVKGNGQLQSRPMSNNRNVEWDGDTWFFAYEDSSQVRQLQQNRQTILNYALPEEVLFIAVTGRGEIVEDVRKKKELWYDELARWFPEGPDDPKLVLIKVNGEYVAVWSKEGDGQLDL